MVNCGGCGRDTNNCPADGSVLGGGDMDTCNDGSHPIGTPNQVTHCPYCGAQFEVISPEEPIVDD